jgi:tetratricopeptide (TPR) repeat protein
MAETLASTLNKPLDPLSLVGQVSRQPDILSRGRAARQATEPLMRGEQGAAAEVRQIQRTGGEELARIGAEQAKESETRATKALKEYETAIGNVPQRPVQQANPNELMELAALTAILGGLAGATGGGRAALAAMEGISEGYKLGQQDVYERGIKDYQAALESYKSNVQAAKNNLDNFFKMENVKKGSGAAELKQFETRLAGTVADAEARRGNFAGALSGIKDMEKAAATAEGRLLTATATAQRKEAKEAAETARIAQPPPYVAELNVPPSGIPRPPIDPLANAPSNKNFDALLNANIKSAETVLDRARQENDKNATKLIQMDRAEGALKRLVLKKFNEGKQKGQIPPNAVLNLDNFSVSGANLPQVTGGVFGLPFIGEFFQQIKTSQDPDASIFRSEAANYQRGSYVPGEGQISNFERELFKQAAIDLGRPVLTNLALIQATRESAKRQMQRMQFFEDYFTQNRTLAGAERLWQAYSENNKFMSVDANGNITYNPGAPNYRTWFRAMQGKSIDDLTPSSPVPQQAPQATTQGQTPTINTKEQFDALPSGSIYIDGETGQRARKP